MKKMATDYRTELLSPAMAAENVPMATQPSWRINMSHHHLPERHVESHFGFGFFLRTLRRHRELLEYYKKQERLLKGYQEVDTYTDLGMLPGKLSEGEMKQLERGEKVAIYASNIGNMVLFAAKMYASLQSRSLAVIASTMDSLLDLLSGFILWFTSHAMSKPDHYKYPIGKNRMQPVGIVVFASAMATLGFQILFESMREIITRAHPAEIDPMKEKCMIGIMVTATLVKVALMSYCCRFKNEIVKAYAQDHFFDVISNSIGFATSVLAIKFYWWFDPLGAILIALYTINNWAKTVMDNVWSLIGKTAPPEYLAKLIYLCWNHDKEVKHIDTLRAYTFGSYYFVEVDIVVSQEMSLGQAHDIGETLHDKLEKLPEIERAFVHLCLNPSKSN